MATPAASKVQGCEPALPLSLVYHPNPFPISNTPPHQTSTNHPHQLPSKSTMSYYYHSGHSMSAASLGLYCRNRYEMDEGFFGEPRGKPNSANPLSTLLPLMCMQAGFICNYLSYRFGSGTGGYGSGVYEHPNRHGGGDSSSRFRGGHVFFDPGYGSVDVSGGYEYGSGDYDHGSHLGAGHGESRSRSSYWSMPYRNRSRVADGGYGSGSNW